MKTLSVKYLKKVAHTICEFGDKSRQFGDTTTTGGTSGDTTTIITTTVTHAK